jgi:RNA polymerase sigma-70 factor, ECF subfamily
MDLVNERKLLNGARSFDLNTLGLIYERYSPGLFRYSMRLLGNENLAEDCLADTFARFLVALKNDHGPDDHLQAYLYRIAHNWITDSYRRSPPVSYELTDAFPTDQPNPEMTAEKRLRQQRVRLALRSLTNEQQQVVVLRFIEGWDHREIAAALGKPMGAVKALQHRAVDKLKVLLLVEEREWQNEKHQ